MSFLEPRRGGHTIAQGNALGIDRPPLSALKGRDRPHGGHRSRRTPFQGYPLFQQFSRALPWARVLSTFGAPGAKRRPS